jgi:hypothetical protein
MKFNFLIYFDINESNIFNAGFERRIFTKLQELIG